MREKILFMSEAVGGHMDNESVGKQTSMRTEGVGMRPPGVVQEGAQQEKSTPLKSSETAMERAKGREKAVLLGRRRGQEPERRGVGLSPSPDADKGVAASAQGESPFIPPPDETGDQAVAERDEVREAWEQGRLGEALRLQHERDGRDPKERETPEWQQKVENLNSFAELMSVPPEQRDEEFYGKLGETVKNMQMHKDALPLIRSALETNGIPGDKIKGWLPDVSPAPTDGEDGGVGVAPKEGGERAEVLPGPLKDVLEEAKKKAAEGDHEGGRAVLEKGFKDKKNWLKLIGATIWLTLEATYFAYCFLMTKTSGIAKQGKG